MYYYILGPLLFLIYVNDPQPALRNNTIYHFALYHFALYHYYIQAIFLLFHDLIKQIMI